MPDDFHVGQQQGHAKPIPYPFLREEDVVWSTTLWKNIDCNELFNQFFYFPSDEYITFGKKSLAYIIWDAMAADEIPIYEDDELKIPLDNKAFFERYTRADTILLEIGYDDDDNELYETVIKPRFFDGSEVFEYALREVWFIGRQDSRQDSRRIALAPLKETYRVVGGGVPDIYLGRIPIFWIPMQNPRVRNLLVRYTAYIDPNNMVNQPSWDWVSSTNTIALTLPASRTSTTAPSQATPSAKMPSAKRNISRTRSSTSKTRCGNTKVAKNNR